jgi:hypothetical protein
MALCQLRPAMNLTTWILHASLLVSDAHGHHPTQPIATEGAQAIARACERQPSEQAQRKCAAVYLVMAFRESGYRLDAIGDGGRARGPFQVHTARAPKTWSEAVEQYTPILVRSATSCAEPLEMLATGRCGTEVGRRISRERMAEADRIATRASALERCDEEP